MQSLFLDPLLAGLSTGLFCCATCYPFLAPLFAAEERSARAIGLAWVQMLGGRLAGYLLFGALFGWLGERFAGPQLDRLAAAGMMLPATVLILYSLGFLQLRRSGCAEQHLPGRPATPALLGFFLGVNVCPPFLMSLAYVLRLHSLGQGLAYFLVFFCATSLYFVPLLFVGLLGRMREFRRAARASALLVGILFLVYGWRQL